MRILKIQFSELWELVAQGLSAWEPMVCIIIWDQISKIELIGYKSAPIERLWPKIMLGRLPLGLKPQLSHLQVMRTNRYFIAA